MEHTQSIANFQLFETARYVNSPLSIEACKREGIEPEELLYHSEDFYHNKANDREKQMLSYELYEKRRRKLIEKVKRRRKFIEKVKRTHKSLKNKLKFRAQMEKQKFDLKRLNKEEKAKQEAKKLIEEKKRTQRKRMEENFRKIDEDRHDIIRTKVEKEIERRLSFQKQLASTKEFYIERNKTKRDRIHNANKKLSEEWMNKKKKFEYKKREEDLQIAEFLKNEQDRVKEKFRNEIEKHQRRTEKAKKTREEKLKELGEKFREKNEKFYDRLKKRGEETKREQELKMHKKLLAQENMEYNKMRMKKIREYIEEELRKKITEDEERIRNLNENKKRLEKFRNKSNQEETIEKERLGETFNNFRTAKNLNHKSVEEHRLV